MLFKSSFKIYWFVENKAAQSRFSFDFIENIIKFCGAAAYFSFMIFNMFTFTQTKLKMAFTAGCQWSLSGRQEHWADGNETSTAPVWLQVKLHWILKLIKGKRSCFFFPWANSLFVHQLIFEFSLWIHKFCDFRAVVQIHDLGWYKSTVISSNSTSINPRHEHRYTVNPLALI